MTKEELLELIEGVDEDLMLADGYEDCILGIHWQAFDHPTCVVYDQTKIIAKLAVEMDYHEAEEYFQFNIAGAYVGEHTPIYVQTV